MQEETTVKKKRYSRISPSALLVSCGRTARAKNWNEMKWVITATVKTTQFETEKFLIGHTKTREVSETKHTASTLRRINYFFWMKKEKTNEIFSTQNEAVERERFFYFSFALPFSTWRNCICVFHSLLIGLIHCGIFIWCFDCDCTFIIHKMQKIISNDWSPGTDCWCETIESRSISFLFPPEKKIIKKVMEFDSRVHRLD